MNRWQKVAWYNLIVVSVALVFTGLCIGILAIKYGMPKALAGQGMLGILGFLGFSQYLFKKKNEPMEFDERDRLIFYKSIQITMAVFFPLFTSVCMIPWFLSWFFFGSDKTISINVFPLLLLITTIPLIVVYSIATLTQYGWRNKNE